MTIDPSPATQGRLWCDVGLLLNRDDPPNGIPRTMSMLTREWLDGRVNLGLLQAVMLREEIDEILPGEPLAPVPQPGQSGPPPRAGWMRGALQRLRRHAKDLARIAYPHVIHLIPRRPRLLAQRALEGREFFLQLPRPIRVRLSGHRPRLAADDVLFSSGASWGDQKYPACIRSLKQTMGFRFVSLIYDIVPLKFPHLVQPHVAPLFQAWFPETLKNSDLLIAISENTRKDIQEFTESAGIPCPPIEVVRLGDELPAGTRENVTSPGEEDPFVLCVGTIEVRKNHMLLYHVWRRLIERHGNRVPRLLLAGAKGWISDDVLHLITKDPLTRARVVPLFRTSDEELRRLYRNCLFTVYPSFYEGWGLPVAESLTYGKFCIASRASSIPEIGGDLLDYHDPYDFAEALGLIERAMFDPAYRAAREAEVRRSYKTTTWAECAASVLAAIERHLGPVSRCCDTTDRGQAGGSP